jgi:dephospho-CoA kinase
VIVLGLTGSIGMGKSTAAATLRSLGLAVFDADRVVHRLLAPGGAAVAAVAAAFPASGSQSAGIDRKLLGEHVFGDRVALARLEAIIHPLVETAEKRFLAQARCRRAPIVVLDIPLLFETGGERRCDYVLVVTAPKFLQRQRVLGRRGMTAERLDAILRQQQPDAAKRRRADFVLQTGLSRKRSLQRLRGVVRLLRNRTCGLPRPRRRWPYRRSRRS